MKNLIVLAAILTLTAPVSWAGGLHLGMTGAVKSKTKELDVKVRQSIAAKKPALPSICACATPVCALTAYGCADSDGDGLSDAWETQGYVDVNCNGVKDAGDLDLPGADPNKPDVYVQYDWMGWGPPGNKCAVAADCTSLGSGHSGETCVSGWCVYSCAVDSDCQTRGPAPTTQGHAKEKCMSFTGTGTNVCQHTHDPEYLAPGALQAVADSFAGHGINLHIIRGHELSHSLVTSFRQDSEMSDTCEGGSTFSSSAGLGKYAVSLYDLKAMSAYDKQNIAYHYDFFGHYSSCDSNAHCSACPAALNPDGTPKALPVAKQTGIAEISGNDFIVSMGGLFGDLAKAPGTYSVGSTFMHELGHNLGLHHGGGIDTPCGTDADCPGGVPGSCSVTPVGKYCQLSNDDNYKPNYLSVMNYRYTLTGILPSPGPGASTPITCQFDADCPSGNRCDLSALPGHCARLDFSTEILPTGGNTPGALDEVIDAVRQGLNEPAGLGSNHPPDLFSYTDAGTCSGGGLMSYASTIGPVDWNGDGDYDESQVSAEIHYYPGVGLPACGTDLKLNTSYVDWGPAAPSKFTYKFQCTPFGGPLGDGLKPSASIRCLTTCPNPEAVEKAHFLYPPRDVKMSLAPEDGRLQAAPAELPRENIRVVIHGDKYLDVADIEQSSLALHRAKPLSIEMKDVDADGRPDLVMLFKRSDARLSPRAKHIRISGWLKNSQAFQGTATLLQP